MAAKREPAGNSKPRVRPATTPEAREQQLGAFAYDLAESQLLDGSASAQVITYFLKSNSVREKLELERLKQENLLTQAKIAQAGQADRMENLMREAMAAFTEYKGGGAEDEEIDFL
jgi:hypothetical protein